MNSEIESKPFILAFRDLMGEHLKTYLLASEKIGGLVHEHSKMVEASVDEQLRFLCLAAVHSAPNQQLLVDLLKPTSDHISKIQNFREKNRANREVFDHLSAISESIPFLGWVTVSPTPGPYVKEMTDSSQFYTNKVLMAFKDKDKTQVEWARSWIAFLTDLQKYIRQHHTTGLVWNARGTPPVAGAPLPAAGGAPPPPPPPPCDLFANMNVSQASGGSNTDRQALLQELNKGSDITKGLKKITAEQQTHKNAALRAQGPTPYKAPSGVKSAPVPPPAVVAKPPKFELQSSKWIIENQVGQKMLTISETEMNQSVTIYRCKDSLVMIKGKVNCINVDTCSKVSIVFNDIVSVVEFINCQSVKAQSMGHVPTINIEKTDSAEIYLNEKCLDVEIVTAKSSAINVSVPSGPDGDFVEYPLPEQFKSIWHGKGFKTEAADKV